MRAHVARTLEFATLILGVAGVVASTLLVLGFVGWLCSCSRPAPSTPAGAAPVVASPEDTDECPGGMCALPGAMR